MNARGPDKAPGHTSDRADDQASDRADDQASDRADDQASGRADDQASGRASDHAPHSGRAGLVLAVVGMGLFAMVGAAQSLYGPLFPLLRIHFDLLASQAGVLVTVHCIGCFAGIALWTAGEARGWARGVLIVCVTLFALGGLLMATAPTWTGTRLGAAIVGLGYGCIVLGINRLFATGFGSRSGAMLNLVNAAFGVAAMIGPLTLGLVADSAKRAVFGGVGVFALLFLPLIRRVRLSSPGQTRSTPISGAAPAAADGASATPAPILPLAIFMALFLLYVATEASIGAWQATYLVSMGYTPAAGAAWTAAFWGAIAVGRIAAAPLSLRLRPRVIVIASLAVAVLALFAMAFLQAGPAAFAVAGLGMAAVFPLSFAWLVQAFPGVRLAGGAAISAATIGGVVGPYAVGQLVAGYDVASAPWALAAMAVAALLCAALLYRLTPAA